MKTIKNLGKSLLLRIDFDLLAKQKISKNEIDRYLPKYLYQTEIYQTSFLSYIALIMIPRFLGLLFRLFLKPRPGKVGDLGPTEVEAVYSKEAPSYERKHHLTTRGMDLVWRRQAAQAVLNYALNNSGQARVLDLCTGTGLTVEEIANICYDQPVDIEVVAIDYCSNMLEYVKRRSAASKRFQASFLRGDATNLTSQRDKRFCRLEPESFDFVSQMFGIGGINEPLQAIKETLRVLKTGGEFFLIDMHKPISRFAGEWPIGWKWLKLNNFEMVCYEQVNLPLALNRLWAWRDTTALFYLARMVVDHNTTSDKWYGLSVRYFEFSPERWWLALPVMPTARALFYKKEISFDEAKKRQAILAACSQA